MASRKNDFVLGLVVIMFISLFVGTIMFIAPRLSMQTRSVVIHFDAERGMAPLLPGSQVLLAGALEVGKVRSVGRERIPSTDGTTDKLMLIVEADIAADLTLYEDCVISTTQPPVGGGGIVVITRVGSPTRPPLGPNDIIRGAAPQSLSAAIANLGETLLGENGLVPKIDAMIDIDRPDSLSFRIAKSLSDVNAITLAMKTQLDPAQQQTLLAKVHVLIDNFVQTTASIAEQVEREDDASILAKFHLALERLDVGIREANGILTDNRDPLRASLAQVQSLTAAMDESLSAVLRRELDPDNDTGILARIHVAMAAANRSLVNVEGITATGNKLIASNAPAIDHMVRNLKAMSEELRLATEELRIAPWRLLAAPDQTTQRKLGFFEAARSFAQAASYLDDAAARLENAARINAEGNINLSDDELREIAERVRSAFDKFDQAEQFLWKQLK